MGKSLLDDIVSQHQWSIGMCLFFLETMKLTFFLLGSNTAKEEIVVNRCCVSGPWGGKRKCGTGSKAGHYGSQGYDSTLIKDDSQLPLSSSEVTV